MVNDFELYLFKFIDAYNTMPRIASLISKITFNIFNNSFTSNNNNKRLIIVIKPINDQWFDYNIRFTLMINHLTAFQCFIRLDKFETLELLKFIELVNLPITKLVLLEKEKYGTWKQVKVIF